MSDKYVYGQGHFPGMYSSPEAKTIDELRIENNGLRKRIFKLRMALLSYGVGEAAEQVLREDAEQSNEIQSAAENAAVAVRRLFNYVDDFLYQYYQDIGEPKGKGREGYDKWLKSTIKEVNNDAITRTGKG